MRWSLERMREEVRDPQPGGSLIAQQLAYVMLVQALRLHLAEGVKGGVGWLFALADKQMRAAITSMHEEPAHQWTLQELAARAGMSRSIFALKFKQTVGTTPMEYLTRWRMMLAADRLKESGDTIYAIASALGYESESASVKHSNESWVFRRASMGGAEACPLQLKVKRLPAPNACRLSPLIDHCPSLICGRSCRFSHPLFKLSYRPKRRDLRLLSSHADKGALRMIGFRVFSAVNPLRPETYVHKHLEFD